MRYKLLKKIYNLTFYGRNDLLRNSDGTPTESSLKRTPDTLLLTPYITQYEGTINNSKVMRFSLNNAFNSTLLSKNAYFIVKTFLLPILNNADRQYFTNLKLLGGGDSSKDYDNLANDNTIICTNFHTGTIAYTNPLTPSYTEVISDVVETLDAIPDSTYELYTTYRTKTITIITEGATQVVTINEFLECVDPPDTYLYISDDADNNPDTTNIILNPIKITGYNDYYFQYTETNYSVSIFIRDDILCDILLVGGGGNGGNNYVDGSGNTYYGGGGGAGEIIYLENFLLISGDNLTIEKSVNNTDMILSLDHIGNITDYIAKKGGDGGTYNVLPTSGGSGGGGLGGYIQQNGAVAGTPFTLNGDILGDVNTGNNGTSVNGGNGGSATNRFYDITGTGTSIEYAVGGSGSILYNHITNDTSITLTNNQDLVFNYQVIQLFTTGTYNVVFNQGSITIGAVVNKSYPILKDVNNNNINPIKWLKFDDGGQLGLDSITNIVYPPFIGSPVYDNVNFIKGNGSMVCNNDSFTISTYTYSNLSYTISFWMRITGLRASFDTIIHNGANTFVIQRNSANQTLRLLFFGGSYTTTNNLYINDSIWRHFCIVIKKISNQVNVYIYVNGVLIEQSGNCGNGFVLTSAFYLGTYNSGTYGFIGNIDDFRLYELELTQTQITELYKGRVSYLSTPASKTGLYGYGGDGGGGTGGPPTAILRFKDLGITTELSNTSVITPQPFSITYKNNYINQDNNNLKAYKVPQNFLNKNHIDFEVNTLSTGGNDITFNADELDRLVIDACVVELDDVKR